MKVGHFVILIIVAIFFVIWFDVKDTQKRCQKLIDFARNHSDSLTALIACEEIKANKSRDAAIQSSRPYIPTR